jgi:amino acid transporter
MPALFFTFDGFYAPTHTFEQMNKPRRGPLAVSIGVIMIALVNILIIVGLYIGSNGQNNTLAMDLPH